MSLSKVQSDVTQPQEMLIRILALADILTSGREETRKNDEPKRTDQVGISLQKQRDGKDDV